MDALEEAGKEIERLQLEVIHLKRMLVDMLPNGNLQPIIVSDEQAVCEMELKRLKEKAFDKPLTMEETKRLDLLVKNLYLIKSKPPTIEASSRHLTDDLLKLAQTNDV